MSEIKAPYIAQAGEPMENEVKLCIAESARMNLFSAEQYLQGNNPELYRCWLDQAMNRLNYLREMEKHSGHPKSNLIEGILQSLLNAQVASIEDDRQRYDACIDQALSDLIYLAQDNRPQKENHDSPIPAPTAI